MKKNQKLFMFTDENISAMIEKLELKDKDVFTVASSGDQALNFLLAGSNSIRLFDFNIYSESYFYLKKSLIENLSYHEFLNFFFPGFFNKKEFFSKDKYNFVKNSLPDGRVREYWDYVFNNYSKQEVKDLFVQRVYDKKDTIKRNDYLKNESNYNKLKEILKKIDKVEFQEIDILHELLYINKQVDFIYLSEILNKIPSSNQVEYLKKIKALILNISSNIKEDGIVAVSYMHCFLDDYWYNLKNNIQTVIANPNNKEDFLNKECQTINFRGGYIPDSRTIKDRDALVLYKPKTKKLEK